MRSLGRLRDCIGTGIRSAACNEHLVPVTERQSKWGWEGREEPLDPPVLLKAN